MIIYQVIPFFWLIPHPIYCLVTYPPTHSMYRNTGGPGVSHSPPDLRPRTLGQPSLDSPLLLLRNSVPIYIYLALLAMNILYHFNQFVRHCDA